VASPHSPADAREGSEKNRGQLTLTPLVPGGETYVATQ